MDSAIVIVNFVVYFITFLWFYKKQKRFTMGVFLLFCYTLVALFCVINYNEDPLQWKLSAGYFVYLYLAIILLLLPFLRNSYETPSGFAVPNEKFYRSVAWIYIALAAFACIVYIPAAYDAIVNPRWTDLYEEAHEEVKGTLFTRFANLFFHLRFLGVALLFYFLTRKRIGWFFKLSLWLMTVLPLVLVTIINASRGGFIEIFLVFVLGYTIFHKSMTRDALRVLKTFALVALPIAAIYIVAVTVARFEDSPYASSTDSSVIYYLGHSMLTFVYGVADTINRFAWGAYMFGLETKGFVNGNHAGTAFMTIVGNLYWDFGPVFSIVFILLFNVFWKKMSKRSLGIPELFLLITYGMTLYRGVFVLGRGWGVQILEAFFIYFMLKFFQGKNSAKTNRSTK